MLFLKKVRWKNFLSTGNQFTEFDLCKNKRTLVVGRNGAGKSTLIDAITYALFGRAFRNINKPQLVSSILKKNMLVEIEFDVDGKNYTVRRGMYPNIFEIYYNETLLNQEASGRDDQSYLDTMILKTNYKTFCQVVVLGSSFYIPFMRLDATPRRNVVEDVLDLQIFTVMNKALKDRIDGCELILKEYEAEVRRHDATVTLLNKHIISLKNVTTKAAQHQQEVISEYQQQIVQLELLIEEINSLYREIESTDDEDYVLKQIKELEKIHSQAQHKIAQLDIEIAFFQKKDCCPTCTQDIGPGFRDRMVLEREEKRFKIVMGMDTIDEELNKLDARRDKIQAIKDDINLLNNKKLNYSSQIKNLEGLIRSIEKESNEVPEDNTEETENKVSELSEICIQIRDKIRNETENKQLMTYASVLLKDTGIKARIIKQYIPVINKLLNKYLAALDFFCEFHFDEMFVETIKSRGRDTFTYGSFSEGEKLRIDLAILFTWREIAKLRNSLDCNLLLFDEILDRSLELEGVEEFVKIIYSLTSDQNVVIISHKEQFQDKFDKVVRFEKIKNFSQMMES